MRSLWATRYSAHRARGFGLVSVAAYFLMLLVTPAQSFPDRVVTIVTTVPPGGSLGPVAQVIASGLSKALGHPVIVEPRLGSGGNLAAAYVANAAPDGHTLMIASSTTLTSNPHVYQSVPFDPEKSFAPIVIPARTNMILVVNPKLNVSNLQEFIRLLKASPDKFNYGSGGHGTLSHLGGAIFGLRSGTKSTHVPYRGIAPALTDLLAGQIDFMFDSATAVSNIKAGKLRALAVVGPGRLAALPDVPTLKELGIDDMDGASGWYVMVTTAGTPPGTVQRLNDEIVKIVKLSSTREFLNTSGLEPAASTPQETAAKLHEDRTRLGVVMKQLNLKLQ